MVADNRRQQGSNERLNINNKSTKSAFCNQPSLTYEMDQPWNSRSLQKVISQSFGSISTPDFAAVRLGQWRVYWRWIFFNPSFFGREIINRQNPVTTVHLSTPKSTKARKRCTANAAETRCECTLGHGEPINTPLITRFVLYREVWRAEDHITNSRYFDERHKIWVLQRILTFFEVSFRHVIRSAFVWAFKPTPKKKLFFHLYCGRFLLITAWRLT